MRLTGEQVYEEPLVLKTVTATKTLLRLTTTPTKKREAKTTKDGEVSAVGAFMEPRVLKQRP